MEVVEAGYKMTEVGIIPSEWELTPLKNICELAKTKIDPQSHSNNFKCVELEHLDQGTGQLLGYEMSKNLLSQKTLFQRGDVLFGKLRPYLRKFLLANFDGVCTSEIWVFRSKQSCESSYLYYLIQTDRIMDAANASTGTKMPRAEWSVVSEVKLPLPPTLTEQKAIATALSDVDALISSLDKLIEKKKAIKQGAMQELLTPPEQGGKRLEGFSGEWISFGFNEVILKVNVKNYQLNSSEYQLSGKYPVVDQGQTEIVAYSDRESLVYKPPKNGVIVFGDHTRILKYLNYSFIAGADGTQILKAKDGFDTAFIYYTLCLKDIPNTGYNRHFKFLKALFLKCPSFQEQVFISGILSDIDSEIQELEIKRIKYKQIKQGMMQELLTGKTRLI